MKINPPQSEAPFQSLSMIRRSNTEALQCKRQIECNRTTNDNQNINKTNEKHVKNYRSSRTPEDGRSLRSSITLRAEQLNIRFLLHGPTAPRPHDPTAPRPQLHCTSALRPRPHGPTAPRPHGHTTPQPHGPTAPRP